MLIKAVLFFLLTLGLAYVSRASLRAQRAQRVPRSHGFHRFFAWEAILALMLLNVDAWFRDPLSWHQILSWCLLLVSLFLVIEGVRLLRQIGKPDSQRDDAPMIGFEKTSTLVTVGLYRYIRHPLYSSLLFFAAGVFFKDPSWLGGLLALAAGLLLLVTARIEEAENIRFFGAAYQEYMRHSKMFIPFLL